MITFVCDNCGQTRTAVRQRCYPCTVKHTPASREKIRRALVGVRHPIERIRKNREAHRGQLNRFAIEEFTRGKPSPRRRPIGSTRISNGHTQIKCPDGKWRYRGRVVWEAAYGPIPPLHLIHHRNENPHDDRLENLQMVTRAEHATIHSTPERMRAAQLLGVAARKRSGRYQRKHHDQLGTVPFESWNGAEKVSDPSAARFRS